MMTSYSALGVLKSHHCKLIETGVNRSTVFYPNRKKRGLQLSTGQKKALLFYLRGIHAKDNRVDV